MRTTHPLSIAPLLLILTLAAAPLHAQAIDDHRLMSRMEKVGGKLHDDGKTISVDALKEQLKRTSCQLQLAPQLKTPRLPGDLYREHRRSVVAIGGIYKCDNCSNYHSSIATGFAIDSNGAVATCHHVIADSSEKSLVVMTMDGKVLPVTEVIASDASNDLAVIRVPGLDVPPLPINPDGQVGQDVAVISHPDGRLWSLTRGSVTRHSIERDRNSATEIFEISADFAGGSSGGPVFDLQGNVVAIVTSTTTVYSDPQPQAPSDNGAQGQSADHQHDHGPQVQMVFKECIPASKLLKLVTSGKPTAP
jgi:S1-C subfamily serine protease